MSKKTSSIRIITLTIIFFILFLTINLQVSNASKTIVVPDNYNTIQKAIKNASPGDTIRIKNGIYYENPIINKSLSIIGENSKNTIIIGKGNVERSQKAVLTLAANQVRIKGLTIKSENYSKSSYYATGISVEGDNCEIEKNNICNTYYGIFCSVQTSTVISSNNITSNLKDGIRFCGGSLNNISDNYISNNSKGGLVIEGYSNTILRNIISNNSRGIGIGSSYSLVFGNEICWNNEFNFFFAGSNNTVSANNISESKWGIYFSPYFAAPMGNKIYHNNFINNSQNVGGNSNANFHFWDNGFPSGGNYWSDYKDRYPDSSMIESSEIANIGYSIDEKNVDNFPLMHLVNVLNEKIPIPQFPSKVNLNSIVAHWTFDEIQPNGVTTDEVGLNYAVVGTSSGNLSFTPNLVDGKVGKALSFDGAAYVNTPILPHLEILDETTIDVWINFQEFKNLKYNNIIVECVRTRSQLPERTFGLAVNGRTSENESIPQGSIIAYVSTVNEGLNEIVTSDFVVELNQWIHIVFTRSLSSGMHIYVDGEEKNITVVSGVLNPQSPIQKETELYVGHDAICLIDELELYNMVVEPNGKELFGINWLILVIVVTMTFSLIIFFFSKKILLK